MRQQTILMEYTVMKGILTKKPKAKALMFHVVGKNVILALQIVGEHQGKLIGVIQGGTQTEDQEYSDQIIDDLKYIKGIEILENLPSTLKMTTTSLEITLKKPSKYVGSKIKFTIDGRLPQGYYFVSMTVKKGYQPTEIYKIDQGAFKAFRSLMTSKISSFTKNKLLPNFKPRG